MSVPKALMDEDTRVRGRLTPKPEEWKQEYEQYGEWYENVLEDVPIDQIELPAPWNSYRLEDNTKKLRATGGMPPVMLWYDDKDGLYKISDGIHRINAAKNLGYKAVPAVVAIRRKYPP